MISLLPEVAQYPTNASSTPAGSLMGQPSNQRISPGALN
jgi:hypothetical protein